MLEVSILESSTCVLEVMMGSVDGFDPVYGKAEGHLETTVPQAFLPFLFCLQPKDDHHLQILLTDFHANTWQAEMSAIELEEMRDEIGIGGTWEEFLGYMRSAFASENVKLILGGPASAVGGCGATKAKVVAQKARGTPRISLALSKLAGSAAHDLMAAIGDELFKAFQAHSASLASEMKRAANLSTALAQEKANTERLQQVIKSFLSSPSQKKQHLNLSELPNRRGLSGKASTPTITAPSTSASLQHSQAVETKPHEVLPRPPHPPVKVRTSRRSKRRGTVIADDDDDEE